MLVYFLRHGLAGDKHWEGNDEERPLTAEGTQRMAREAVGIEALGLQLDAIITSPLTRAAQTAQIVAEHLQFGYRVVEDERLAPGFDRERFSALLAEHDGAAGVMLVGHETDLSKVICQLIGGGRVELKKGALAAVDYDEKQGTGLLLWLASPRLLGA